MDAMANEVPIATPAITACVVAISNFMMLIRPHAAGAYYL
jgi:hypothetical protein